MNRWMNLREGEAAPSNCDRSEPQRAEQCRDDFSSLRRSSPASLIERFGPFRPVSSRLVSSALVRLRPTNSPFVPPSLGLLRVNAATSHEISYYKSTLALGHCKRCTWLEGHITTIAFAVASVARSGNDQLGTSTSSPEYILFKIDDWTHDKENATLRSLVCTGT